MVPQGAQDRCSVVPQSAQDRCSVVPQGAQDRCSVVPQGAQDRCSMVPHGAQDRSSVVPQGAQDRGGSGSAAAAAAAQAQMVAFGLRQAEDCAGTPEATGPGRLACTAMESSSSKKSTQGADWRACGGRSKGWEGRGVRTRCGRRCRWTAGTLGAEHSTGPGLTRQRALSKISRTLASDSPNHMVSSSGPLTLRNEGGRVQRRLMVSQRQEHHRSNSSCWSSCRSSSCRAPTASRNPVVAPDEVGLAFVGNGLGQQRLAAACRSQGGKDLASSLFQGAQLVSRGTELAPSLFQRAQLPSCVPQKRCGPARGAQARGPQPEGGCLCGERAGTAAGQSAEWRGPARKEVGQPRRGGP